MYGIFTYIWVVLGGNVGKYTIHGCYWDSDPIINIYLITMEQFLHEREELSILSKACDKYIGNRVPNGIGVQPGSGSLEMLLGQHTKQVKWAVTGATCECVFARTSKESHETHWKMSSATVFVFLNGFQAFGFTVFYGILANLKVYVWYKIVY